MVFLGLTPWLAHLRLTLMNCLTTDKSTWGLSI
jgi:hypothetical protein